MNKTNEQNRTRDMETRNRLTAIREEGGGGNGEKEGEGSSQGTCINDPWALTTGLGLTVGAGVVGGTGESNGGIIGTCVVEQQ